MKEIIITFTITALSVLMLCSMGLNYAQYKGVFNKSAFSNEQIDNISSLPAFSKKISG